jgi:hypothetical protein
MNIDQEFVHKIGNSSFALETELINLRQNLTKMTEGFSDTALSFCFNSLQNLEQISSRLKEKVLDVKKDLEI